MAKMPKEVQDLIRDQGTPKIVATVDKNGIPNVTVKGSLTALDDETLAFADLYGDKTRTYNNLTDTKNVSILTYKVPMEPPFPAYQVKGQLAEYQTSGPMFDQFAKAIKDAIGADIAGVGIMKVEGVYSQSPKDAGKQIA